MGGLGRSQINPAPRFIGLKKTFCIHLITVYQFLLIPHYLTLGKIAQLLIKPFLKNLGRFLKVIYCRKFNVTMNMNVIIDYVLPFLLHSSQVIDDEKHLKELELKKAKKKGGDPAGTATSALDVPLPNSNNIKKRSKIKTYDIKHDELDEDRTLIERGTFILQACQIYVSTQ